MVRRNVYSLKDVDRTIQQNLQKLRKPGVLTVRPGYEIAGDQLTGKQAIVATVHTKRERSALSRQDILPDKIGRFPVDVREASAYQRLHSSEPAAAALTAAYGRPEDKEPEWPNEREMPSGKPLASRTSDTQKAFDRSKKTQPIAHRALAARQAKDQLPYRPPATCPPLDPVQVTATITAHVSPDAGFATLTKFLAQTRESLTVGMYDFTSGPILNDFLTDLDGTKILQMVLDNPAPNPTRDQLDGVTVEELDAKFGARARIARALARSDKFASEWIFPSAYHIKVIVRDGKSFWLSSGNLNNSNQPDPSRPPHTEDRDWHVIIANEELAKTFAAYLNYDFEIASQHQVGNPGVIENAIEDAQMKKSAFSNPPPSRPPRAAAKPVPAKTFKNVKLTITPLMTPDTLPSGQPQYLDTIVKLIKSAQKSIYIQLQYIEASKGDGSAYEELLLAIADQVAAGLDVKLIESRQYGLKWVEKMKLAGVDLTTNIGLQYDVHNKGFIIDSQTAVVSSQNFSPEGVQSNRDAGVIIENAHVAQYFESVFLSDWKTRTIPAVSAAAKAPAAKRSGKAKKKPAGGQ